MRILLTGKNGQVGFELQRSLAVLGEVIAVDQTDCDLTDPVSLRRLVAGLEPQIIVNPAAYTAVDRAESSATSPTRSMLLRRVSWARKQTAWVPW